MPDMEKVKKGVWQCWLPSTEEEYATQCHDCPYYEPGITLEECMTALRTDTLAMLKEQDELINELLDLGYPHNFQHEAPWVVDYLYKLTEIIKKAFKAKERR